MNYWLADNHDQAEQNALHFLIGYLSARDEAGLTVTAKGVLDYIERAVAGEEQRLNKSFPNKAREIEIA